MIRMEKFNRREKAFFGVESGSTAILDGQTLKSLNILYYLFGGNKGVHQLRGYRRAVDLRLCLCICKKQFLMTQLICPHYSLFRFTVD